MKEVKILGLDFGSKTVGVALSDALGLLATGVKTIWRKDENKLRRTLAEITEICEENRVTRIVLGLPCHMDGSEGERAQKTREFARALEQRTGLPVILWDERLTTVEADGLLEDEGVPRDRRKAAVDTVAAELILQGYLDYGREDS